MIRLEMIGKNAYVIARKNELLNDMQTGKVAFCLAFTAHGYRFQIYARKGYGITVTDCKQCVLAILEKRIKRVSLNE